MAPIRTFTLNELLSRTQTRPITVALGNHTGGGTGGWVLIRTSAPADEYEPREWATISVRTASAEPPHLTTGNAVIALKNYSEHVGLPERLEAAGMVRHTGRELKQQYVTLPLVEVLVAKEELIRRCGKCERWEEVDAERFKACSRCKARYYCSKECQAGDWKAEHKVLCKPGLTEDQVFAADQAKMGDMLQKMGLKTMNLDSDE